MDFTEFDHLAEYRAAARGWAQKHLRPEWVEQEHETGTHHNAELHALLAEQGLLAAGWPVEYGGSTVEEGYAQAVFAEIGAYGLRMDGWITTWMILHTVLHTATEEQKQAIVPPGLRGESIVVLGYTEPGSGSDMAAAQTRAVADGDGWVIDGSKMFTSTAHVGSHVFLLTRTDPAAAKHRGLTLFLVPLDLPGIEVQPIHTMGGQRTNATFYSSVRVPDSARIGAAGGGWGVMRTAMIYERGVPGTAAGTSLAERFAAWARTGPDGPGVLYDDPAVQEELARIAIEDEVGDLLRMRVAWMSDTGRMPGTEGAMSKLFSTEAAQRQHGALLDLLGPAAVLEAGAAGAPLNGEVEHAFRNSVVGTIYGGASEIMREIVAERRLTLPRSRPVT